MSCQTGVYQWTAEVSAHLPALHRSQARVLALWSFGTVLPAGCIHAWRGEWLRLLRLLRPAVPKGVTVIVLADRGLYAPWLFRRIVRLGWHPCLRVNGGGSFRPACGRAFVPFRSLLPAVGSEYAGTGSAFKTKDAQLPCTLLGRWEAGDTDPG